MKIPLTKRGIVILKHVDLLIEVGEVKDDRTSSIGASKSANNSKITSPS